MSTRSLIIREGVAAARREIDWHQQRDAWLFQDAKRDEVLADGLEQDRQFQTLLDQLIAESRQDAWMEWVEWKEEYRRHQDISYYSDPWDDHRDGDHHRFAFTTEQWLAGETPPDYD